MEENKIVKYQGGQLQSISNKIIITKRILNDISTGVQMKLNEGKYVGNNEKNILIII